MTYIAKQAIVRIVLFFVLLLVRVQYCFAFWLARHFWGLLGAEGEIALYAHIGGFVSDVIGDVLLIAYGIKDDFL